MSNAFEMPQFAPIMAGFSLSQRSPHDDLHLLKEGLHKKLIQWLYHLLVVSHNSDAFSIARAHAELIHR